MMNTEEKYNLEKSLNQAFQQYQLLFLVWWSFGSTSIQRSTKGKSCGMVFQVAEQISSSTDKL